MLDLDLSLVMKIIIAWVIGSGILTGLIARWFWYQKKQDEIDLVRRDGKIID